MRLPTAARSRAVLIGVSVYDHLQQLPAVANNVPALADVLCGPKSWGLAGQHCTVVSEPETAPLVIDAVTAAAEEADDTLLVYFSGHGLVDPRTGDLLLALRGSRAGRPYTAMPYEWVRQGMLDSAARRKIVILDCCFSGRALGMMADESSSIIDQVEIEGTYVLAAAAETRTALAAPGERYTAFTGELLRLINDGVAGGPPLLDLDTSYLHIKAALQAKRRPIPQQRARNTVGRLVLARNSMHGATGSGSRSLPGEPPADARETAVGTGAVAEPGRAEGPARAADSGRAVDAGPEEGPAPAAEPAPVGEPAPVADSGRAVDAGPAPVAEIAPVPEEPDPTPDEDVRSSAVAEPTPLLELGTPAAHADLGRYGAATVPGTRPRKARYRAAVAGSVVLGLLAVWAVPKTVAWLKEAPTGRGGGDAADGYDAATKGIVNRSVARGGTLKFAGEDVDSWDPQRSYAGHVWNFSRYFTRQLFTYNPRPARENTSLEPDLAVDGGEVSDGGKTYTFTLRDGLTWEDGSELTSRDIKYGIERLWAQEVISGGPLYLQQVLDPSRNYPGPYKDKTKNKLGLSAIETPDDKTIVFHLHKPNSDFRYMLAMTAASPVKAEKDTRDRYGLKPFSSGPYRFESYELNNSLTLVRNEHWRQSSDPVRRALPDRITVKFFADPEQKEAALLRGDYDLDISADGLGPKTRAKALADERLKAHLDNPLSSILRFAALPRTVKPMDNIHCRKAVIYAADKKALQAALGGSAEGDIAPNMLPPGVRGSERGYDPYGALDNHGAGDTAKAKEQLTQCGRPKGFSTVIAAQDQPLYLNPAKALKASLAKVGIKARIDTMESVKYHDTGGSPEAVAKNRYGIIIRGWYADFPTGQGFLQPLADGRFIAPSGNTNVGELDDPEINRLFDKAFAQPDRGKADEIYRQINRKVSEAAVYLPFTYQKNVLWRGARLTNVYTAEAYDGAYDFVSLGAKGS